MGLSVGGLGLLGISIIAFWLGNADDGAAYTGNSLQYAAGFGMGASSIALFARVGGGKPEGDDGNAEEAKSTNGEAHHGATVVGNREGSGLATVLCGHGGAAVGRGGGTHAGEPGGDARDGTKDERDDGFDATVASVDEEQHHGPVSYTHLTLPTKA